MSLLAKRLFIILVFFSSFAISPTTGSNDPSAQYKLSASYSVPKKSPKLKLRVTEIPQELGWIQKDLDGNTVLPRKGSIIVFESTENLKISSLDNSFNYLPAGTKFWARLNTVADAKSFNRKGKIKLDFYQAQIPIDSGSKQMDLEGISFDSQAKSKPLTNSLKSISRVGAYTLGGALSGPFVALSITGSGLLGLGALSNPYVLGGSSALGGALGLVYGISKKGSDYTLEPGSELNLELKEPWQLEPISLDKTALDQQAQINNSKFEMKITQVSKTKDLFDEKALKIKLNYKNLSKEKLFYTNFLLIDSMGKEFYPANHREDEYSTDGLPPEGSLELVYSSDFLNAIHSLRVLTSYNQKLLCEQKIFIK